MSKFNTPYDDNHLERTLKTAYVTPEGVISKTIQSAKAECDINVIVDRFQKTGVLPIGNSGSAIYGDFTAVPDYMEAKQVIIDAEAAFYSLPSDLRLRFANDPAKFLAFCDDPNNGEELIRLGLRQPPASPSPDYAPLEGSPEGKKEAA